MRKQVGSDQWPAVEAQVRDLYKRMVRVAIAPDWAKLIDFETTLPSAVEQLIAQRRAGE